MLGDKTSEEWIEEYSKSHQHPLNKLTHQIGIPMIAVSIPLFLAALFVRGFWIVPLSLFIIGWIFQFVGHAFERKPPEFFRDWRFLFVGLRWWMKKTFGKQ